MGSSGVICNCLDENLCSSVAELFMLICCSLEGTCSPAQTEAISQMHPETTLGCHLSFTSDAIDFSASDVFNIHTAFDSSIGKVHLCLLN